MMGTQDGQPGLFSYQIKLDKRVRSENPLKRGHPLKVPIKTKVSCTGFPSLRCFFFG
jgi:hypothetical protein